MRPDVRIFWSICRLLLQLGASPSHAGFFHSAYAVLLVMEEPRRILLVTKWLYPDVASYYHTSWSAVERGIRTVVHEVWEACPEQLADLAEIPLNSRPTASHFIFILAKHLSEEP